jgi:hypothetical protein
MIKGNNRQVEMIISDTIYLPFSATQLLVLILDQCSVTGKRGLEGAPDISDAAAQHSGGAIEEEVVTTHLKLKISAADMVLVYNHDALHYVCRPRYASFTSTLSPSMRPPLRMLSKCLSSTCSNR